MTAAFVEDTVEDPACGAHEAFLDELVGVADDVRFYSVGDDPAARLHDALRPSWP